MGGDAPITAFAQRNWEPGGLGGQERGQTLGSNGGTQGCGRGMWAPSGGQKLQGSLLGSRGLCPGLSRHKASRAGAVGHLSPPPLSPGTAWKGAALPASTKAGTRGRSRPTAKVQPSPIVARGRLTLVGAVGMSFITVVPTIIVPVARPVHGDAAPAVALELVAGAGVAAACLVAVVPAVVVCKEKGGEGGSASTRTPGGGLAEAQRGEKGRDPR